MKVWAFMCSYLPEVSELSFLDSNVCC